MKAQRIVVASILIIPWVPLMHAAFSKSRRALTARGVTLLSLLASTVSFASVVYVGPETARESLGIERSIEVVMPDPEAAFAGGTPSARPFVPAISRVEPVADVVRIGGMAVGLRTDEAADASRMAPLAASLGRQATDALQELQRAIEPTIGHCAPASLSLRAQDVDYVLHPMSAFLASGPDVDITIRDWLRHDGEAGEGHTGPMACLFHERGENHGLAKAGQ